MDKKPIMNDKEMFEKLLEDKGEKFQVIIDNDSVTVWNKETEVQEYLFEEYQESFIEKILKYLGLDAELC